jgi:hypothetical protein
MDQRDILKNKKNTGANCYNCCVAGAFQLAVLAVVAGCQPARSVLPIAIVC